MTGRPGDAPPQANVELIVRSVMRDFGIGADVRGIALSVHEWKIEIAGLDGTRTTLTVVDSSPQNMRRSIMAALDVEC